MNTAISNPDDDAMASGRALPYAQLFAGLAITYASEVAGLGLISRHMAQHLATMTLIAPAIAMLAHARGAFHRGLHTIRSLWVLALLQIALLWGWHAPSVFASAHDSPLLMPLMHASLFLAAYLFWGTLLSVRRRTSWHAIAALLVTGKMSCLLGALLVFAPRSLYDAAHIHHSGVADAGALADQHLAGLLMVTACPLTYVAAAIWLAATWLNNMERDDATRTAMARA